MLLSRSSVPGNEKIPAGETRDRPAEPFEIVEAMADEVAEDAAAMAAARLPALEAQARGLVLDIPVDHDMAQSSDLAGREHRLGSPPRRELGKVEIDHPRPPGFVRARRAWPAHPRDRRRAASRRTPACRGRARAAQSRAADQAAPRSPPRRPTDRRPALSSRRHRAERSRRARTPRCVPRRCRRAPPPRNAGRRGTPG